MKAKKPYTKHYYPSAALAHFVAQSSPYAQRMLTASVGKSELSTGRARVAWEKGRTLHELRGRLVARLNRKKVLEQLADAVVEHMRLGIEHRDLHGGNLLVSGGVFGPVQIKIIDYELANPLLGRWLGKQVRAPGTNDYAKVVEHVIPALAYTVKDEVKLREFFRRKFLERVEGL